MNVRLIRSQPIVVVDAPSNLGLRPPENGSVPGCYKLPWALRDRGLLPRLNAEDGGCVVPPRYRSDWRLGEGDRNAVDIAKYSLRLADRLQSVIGKSRQALVLGGDCSILIGNMLALRRLGCYGLVFLDAHSDFRHPGNATPVGAAAGEDLAIVTGMGDSRLINLDGLGPYVRGEDVHVVGVRDSDEALAELSSINVRVTTSQELLKLGHERVADDVLATVTRQTTGFWIHFDVDVVDSSEISAVDCPEPKGLPFSMISALIGRLFDFPKCAGMEVTIYDPDLDQDGIQAERIIACLTQALCDPRREMERRKS